MTCTGWSEKSTERTERIDTMLNFMSCLSAVEYREHGRVKSYTLEEIADFCGCDVMVIKRTEQLALEKVRSNNPELALYLPDDERS